MDLTPRPRHLPLHHPDQPDPGVERLAFAIRLAFIAGLALALVAADAVRVSLAP